MRLASDREDRSSIIAFHRGPIRPPKTNKFGIVGWQRPSKADMTPYIYIGKDKP